MKKEFPFNTQNFNITIRNNQYEIDVTSIASESIGKLVEWLPNDMELEFYDYQGHEYQSDRDGSYIDVQRYENGYAFKGGNHGRSSGWKRISKPQLMEFIMHNIKQKDAFIRVSPIVRKVDDWDESYLKDIK
ncbi:hypothetical protein [Pontibacter pudoricolor]|uniref:hypothetical protein n=1 Tax=Pontibacter pudoricolor TaxID=2694930 RepID=UPI001390E2A9|nr:hypothetical protein [Pontibacter pudoricolor]